MPEARLELAQGFNSPTDFKSGASADSATRAFQTSTYFIRTVTMQRVRMEARGGIEPPISVLQTDALPLCYRAMIFMNNLRKSGLRAFCRNGNRDFYFWEALTPKADTDGLARNNERIIRGHGFEFIDRLFDRN